jgi:FkbM family methyltransferase
LKTKQFLSKLIANNPVNYIIFFFFKKRISFNHITIRVISFLLRQRIPFHNLIIDVSDKVISPMTKALIYWGSYEKRETIFVQKYLTGTEDIVELGSSIGVIGSIISQKQTQGKYISVEANPELINANKKNLALNRKSDYVLLNRAVDYANKTISFTSSANTLAGKIDRKNLNASAITVETITLNEICTTYNLTNFTLVSDIEGAEITILIKDGAALKKCEKMIIELHNTEYEGIIYSIPDLVTMIINHNFSILDQYESVFVFQRNELNITPAP